MALQWQPLEPERSGPRLTSARAWSENRRLLMIHQPQLRFERLSWVHTETSVGWAILQGRVARGFFILGWQKLLVLAMHCLLYFCSPNKFRNNMCTLECRSNLSCVIPIENSLFCSGGADLLICIFREKSLTCSALSLNLWSSEKSSMVLLWKALCLFTTSSRPLLIRLHLEYKSFSWHPVKLTWRYQRRVSRTWILYITYL